MTHDGLYSRVSKCIYVYVYCFKNSIIPMFESSSFVLPMIQQPLYEHKYMYVTKTQFAGLNNVLTLTF